MSDERFKSLSARYVRFAEQEAAGRSPIYEAFALGVAGSAEVIGFLMTVPSDKQQPNLLFASVRHLFGVRRNWADFRDTLLANADAVRSVMMAHATQTNEPARCAVLLPLLAQIPGPLALVEVGASGGLCLLPDFYGYDYGGLVIRPHVSAYPVFACVTNDATPIPTALPRIVWRAGLDLNPLDVRDPEHAAWLETLVWPEQSERLGNLRSAIAIAGKRRPRIVRGDLRGDALDALCHEAPKDATLVIFHTAVLAYVASRAERQAFATRAMSLCPYWISNEVPGAFPDVAGSARQEQAAGRFLLSVNGRQVAWTDPHGASVEWIGRTAHHFG